MGFFDYIKDIRKDYSRADRARKVDPVLGQQLLDRGKKDEYQNLQSSLRKNKVDVVKEYGDQWKKVATSSGDFVGGALGKVMGVGLGAKNLAKEKEKRISSINYNTDILNEKLKDPDIPETEKLTIRNNLKDNIKQLGEMSSSTMGDLTQGVTNKDVLLASGELALTAALGLKLGTAGRITSGSLRSSKAIKDLNNFKKSIQLLDKAKTLKMFPKTGKLINALTHGGKQALIDAGLGAGFMGLGAEREGKSPSEVKKDAAMGALIFGSLAPVLGLTGTMIKGASKYVGKKVRPVWRQLEQSLEKTAYPTFESNTSKATNITEDIMSSTSRTTFGQGTAKNLLKVNQFVKDIPTKYINELHPLVRIDKAIEDFFGSSQAKLESRFRRALPSADSKSSIFLDTLLHEQTPQRLKFFEENGIPYVEKSIEKFKPIANEIEARIQLLDEMDRVMLGNTTPRFGEITTEAEKAKALQTLKTKLNSHISKTNSLGIEGQVQEAKQIISDYNKQLLTMQLKAGFISPTDYAVIQGSHPNYLRHNVLDNNEEIAIEFFGSSALTPKTPTVKAEGSKKLIDPAFDSIEYNTPLVMRNIEKNNAVGGLINVQESYGVIPEVSPIRTAEMVIEKNKNITILKELRLDLIRQKGNLSKIKTNDKILQKRIDTLKKEVTEREQKITSELSNFFQEGNELAYISPTSKNIPKIPESLHPEAKIAKNTTKDKFLESNTLLKEFEDGTLERNGFNSRGHFWEDANAGVVKSGGTKTTKTVEGDINKVIGLTKEQQRRTSDLDKLISIDKVSVNNRLNQIENEINTINSARSKAYQNVLNNADKQIPKTAETIPYWRDGIKETWAVPKDVGEAIKHLGAEQTHGNFFNFIKKTNDFLKAGATRYNLSFGGTNFARDRQTAAVTSRAFINEMATKMGVTPQSVGYSRKELDLLLKAHGGSQASVFSESKNLFGEKVAPAVQEFKQSNIATLSKEAGLLKNVERVNEGLENSTRLKVFKMALENGLSKADAAMISRNATIDFGKMGTKMRSLNQVIPFLNARVQATINTGLAAAKSPEVYTRAMMYTAVYPTLALDRWNSQFESSKNISQHIKDNYWPIMVGEKEGIDIDNKKVMMPQYFTIRKGEIQGIVSNPIQYFLDKSRDNDPRKVSEMIADTIGSISPISTNQFGSSDPLLSLISQAGPVPSLVAGFASNRVPYSGAHIIPPHLQNISDKSLQTKKTTPEIINSLGKKLNFSPAQIDFTIKTLGGGAPSDVIKVMDQLVGFSKGEGSRSSSYTDTTWGKLSSFPGTRRFFGESGAYYSPTRVEDRKETTKIKESVKTQEVKYSNTINSIVDNMQKQTKEENLKMFEKLDSSLTDKNRKDILKEIQTRSSIVTLKKTDKTSVRAIKIFERMQKLDNREEILKYLEALEKEKILTDTTRKKLMQLLQKYGKR